MAKIKVGLALGSGAARGLAHIGAIKALVENDIPIDAISGTSIGAVVGIFYAAGLSIEKMTDFAMEFGSRRIAYWMDPAFFRGSGLLKGSKIEEALSDLVGPVKFKDLKIPFYVIATDLVTGSEVVFSQGEVVRAVRASFAIPGIFSPIKHDGRWLVDGALVAPVPTRILSEKNCDVIIAIDVGAEPENEESISRGEKPKVFDVLMQSFYIIQEKLNEPCMKMADVGIIPEVGDYGWTDFSRAKELIDAGYKATIRAIPLIRRIILRKRKIPFLRRLFKS